MVPEEPVPAYVTDETVLLVGSHRWTALRFVLENRAPPAPSDNINTGLLKRAEVATPFQVDVRPTLLPPTPATVDMIPEAVT